ncbi:hypothetical protein [Piscirickettsia salmonis]|uniref:hypothetical protein n=1 Tax=Piscirickettsia salmonis TaxID=1238 RepID=UPI003A7FC9B9
MMLTFLSNFRKRRYLGRYFAHPMMQNATTINPHLPRTTHPVLCTLWLAAYK